LQRHKELQEHHLQVAAVAVLVGRKHQEQLQQVVLVVQVL
jgi:hypothetical protein